MRDLSGLRGLDKDILLQWFLYHMPMERRRILMQEFPRLYNRLYQREIMKPTAQVRVHEKDSG